MAFRYVKIEIMSQSRAYDPSLSDFYVKAVSSADERKLKPLHDTACDMWKRIDRVAVRTLHNCMQMVFEDGPKRDRRLWMGDLRLQALTNYETFGNMELAERCLKLFAELRTEKCIPAFVYEKPTYFAGETVLMDYSIMFTAALDDYCEYSDNKSFITEMWQVARDQLEWAMSHVKENGIVEKQKGWYCFIDWCDALEKIAALQGITIYGFDAGTRLVKRLGFLRMQPDIKPLLTQCGRLHMIYCMTKSTGCLSVMRIIVSFPGHRRFGWFWQMFSIRGRQKG